MLSRPIILTACLCWGAAVWGQPSTISLLTKTQPGPPVHLHGTLTATSKTIGSGQSVNSYEADISATNVSTKGIVLLIIKLQARDLDIGEDDTIVDIQDYFFSTQVFEPNETKLIPEFGPPFIKGSSLPRSINSRARGTASVMFVQFLDGSTWGDPKDGESALRQRYVAWFSLKSLMETVRTKGTEEFVRELMQPDDPSSLGRAYLFQVRNAYVRNEKDPKHAIEELQTMLGAADSHTAALGQYQQEFRTTNLQLRL